MLVTSQMRRQLARTSLLSEIKMVNIRCLGTQTTKTKGRYLSKNDVPPHRVGVIKGWDSKHTGNQDGVYCLQLDQRQCCVLTLFINRAHAPGGRAPPTSLLSGVMGGYNTLQTLSCFWPLHFLIPSMSPDYQSAEYGTFRRDLRCARASIPACRCAPTISGVHWPTFCLVQLRFWQFV